MIYQGIRLPCKNDQRILQQGPEQQLFGFPKIHAQHLK